MPLMQHRLEIVPRVFPGKRFTESSMDLGKQLLYLFFVQDLKQGNAVYQALAPR